MVSEKRRYWENSLVGLDLLTVLLDPQLSQHQRTVKAKQLVDEVEQKRTTEAALFAATRFLLPSLALAYKQPVLSVIEGLQLRLVGFPLKSRLVPADSWDDLVPSLSEAQTLNYVSWVSANAARVYFRPHDLEGCVSNEEHDRTVHLMLVGLNMSAMLSDHDVTITPEEWDRRGILWGKEVDLHGLLSHLAVPLVDEFVNIYGLERLEVIEALREGILTRIVEDMGSED